MSTNFKSFTRYYAIVHPIHGTLLGLADAGDGEHTQSIWSGLNPHNCASAPAMPEGMANEMLENFQGSEVDGAAMVPVIPDIQERYGKYASLSACRSAGVPLWLGPDTPVANSLLI